MILNREKLVALIKGASLFTTGGGVPTADQLKTIQGLKNPKIRLVKPEELPKGSFVITAAEVGPSNAPQIEKAQLAKNMLKALEKVVGAKIAGVYPPEIGQESVVIECAYYLNLPIIDFDPTGFRAVPYMDVNVFKIKDLSYSYMPLALGTFQGDIYTISGEFDYERAEKTLREMTSLSEHNIVFILGGLIPVSTFSKQKLTIGSYSKALEYGMLNSYPKFIKEISANLLIEGKVTKIVEKEKKGFLFQNVTIKSVKNDYLLTILNEALILRDLSGKVLASVPERILLIDAKKFQGIPSGDLKKGQELSIVVINPEKEWTKHAVKNIFDINRFKELL